MEEYSNIYLGFNEKQKNELVYFQGSVLERKDTNNFNKYINNKKFNFIFINLLKPTSNNDLILYFFITKPFSNKSFLKLPL